MVLLGPCWRLLAKTQRQVAGQNQSIDPQHVHVIDHYMQLILCSVTVAETVARDIFEAITLGKKADRLKVSASFCYISSTLT